MIMNAWNITRAIIFAGLCITAYLLLMQWSEYQKNSLSHPTKSAFSTDNAFVSNLVNKNSASESQANDLLGDLPPAPLVLSNEKSILSPSLTDYRSENQVVRIKTDVLELLVDLNDGKIISSALLEYPISLEEDAPPVKLFEVDDLTYIAQSGLIGQSGFDLDQSDRPRYQSVNNTYNLKANESTLIAPMTVATENGLVITKKYHLERQSYQIKVSYQVINTGNEPWVGYLFGQLKRDSSPDPGEVSSAFPLPTYLGTAYWTQDKPYRKLGFDDINLISKSQPTISLDQKVVGGWVSIVQHYFLTAWIPPRNETSHITARKNQQGDNIIGFTSKPFQVLPGDTVLKEAHLYVGPKLKASLEQAAEGLELAIDYGMLFFLSNWLMVAMKWINSLVGNWGVSVILLTCLVKLFFYYPSAMSYRSMAKMRLVQPKMQQIKERFEHDKQRLSQEMLKLYKNENINPVGGCLPMLLQMPVFLALYWALMESVELRQAPFVGWIQDLSSMDPYFVLPLLMGASMFIQMRLNPQPADPMQAKVMQFMPIVFTVVFLFFPAGLVLYSLTNNILTIAQQWWITRSIAAATKSA